MLRSATGIVCNSQATLDELTRYAKTRTGPSSGKLPPTVVAPLGSSKPAAIANDRPFGAPYFVMLGTIEPRKNHWMILHVWRALAARMGQAAPRLVIIGQRGWNCENVVDMLERCDSLRGLVHELPRCTDRELHAWLGHAQALLFPSFAEGFGLPLVEALARGTPVIASDLASFRQAAGDVPEYADPLDGRHWLELIQDYRRTDSQRRVAQIARIAQYAAPDWDQHFRIVERFLQDLSLCSRHD
jgi:glycosyltransferase involved in cell wall biosynthesis